MNIQGLNPLSLSSVTESSGVGELPSEGGHAGMFSATLLDQLAQLQSSLQNAGMADTAQFGGLSGGINNQNMQEFAALFGKNLPTASKLDQDINLDDTLQTLADVLQYLQSLETLPAAGQNPVLPAMPANQQDFADVAVDNAELAKQQAENAAALGLIQAQKQFEAGKQALGEAMKTAAVAGETMPAINNGPQLPGTELKQDALSALNGGEDPQIAGSLNGSFAKSLSGQDGAFGQTGQDSGANAFLSEQDTAAKPQIGSGDAGSSLSRMTADIAQLNKSVNSAGQSPAPAIAKPFTHPGWNAELGEKLLWMHKQAVPSAEIRLNPEHLGPISIKIDVNQDQASVAFTAQHAAVRDAIEAAIPKLREMLGGQNLNLADVNVSQQQSEQKQGRDFFQMAGEQNRRGQSQDPDETLVNEGSTHILDEIEAGRAIASNGLLSLFA